MVVTAAGVGVGVGGRAGSAGAAPALGGAAASALPAGSIPAISPGNRATISVLPVNGSVTWSASYDGPTVVAGPGSSVR